MQTVEEKKAKQRERNARYRAEHREELNAKQRAYYAEHRDERIAYQTRYQAEHKDERKAYHARHHAENRDEILTKKRAHYAENLEEIREKDRNRLQRHTRWMQDIREAQGCTGPGPHEGRLEHHHIDPATKLYNTSQMAHCSLGDIFDEIAKCTVLCVACHNKRHEEMRKEATWVTQ